jgi:hypothetical protein
MKQEVAQENKLKRPKFMLGTWDHISKSMKNNKTHGR